MLSIHSGLYWYARSLKRAILALSPEVRGIVAKLEVSYHKKARGLLEVTSECEPPSSLSENTEFLASAEARDSEGDIVSSISVTWILGPTKK